MSDKQYRAWIQTLPSCISGKYSEWLPEIGEWRNPACHVRRAGMSGTAYKAPFSCVPMTHAEHAHQHQHGEISCLQKFTKDRGFRRELDQATSADRRWIATMWFDAQVEKYRKDWQDYSALKEVPSTSQCK